MDRVLFTVVAYLPVISGALGIGFLSAYLYNRVIRKKFIPNFLIIGCVGIGNFLLVVCAFFLSFVVAEELDVDLPHPAIASTTMTKARLQSSSFFMMYSYVRYITILVKL